LRSIRMRSGRRRQSRWSAHCPAGTGLGDAAQFCGLPRDRPPCGQDPNQGVWRTAPSHRKAPDTVRPIASSTATASCLVFPSIRARTTVFISIFLFPMVGYIVARPGRPACPRNSWTCRGIVVCREEKYRPSKQAKFPRGQPGTKRQIHGALTTPSATRFFPRPCSACNA